MTEFGWKYFAVFVLALSPLTQTGFCAATNQPASFQEAYDLIRNHLDGVTDAELQQAAVEGLVKQLQPRVQLVGGASDTNSAPQSPPLAKSAVYDGPVAYFRVASVSEGLAQGLDFAIEAILRTNDLKGIVLDLRFADGEDYAAVGGVADLFVGSERLLLDWGTGSARSSAKTNAVKLPVVTLVNQETRGAAEALAAVLRDAGVGLVLGTNTSGSAVIADEFNLRNGQRLRVAKSGVKLGNGEALTASGIKPDIEVAVSAENERLYFTDPYKDAAAETNRLSRRNATGTNTVAGMTNRYSRRRYNEAELVREHKNGSDFDTETSDAATGEPEKPLVRDPALARALDLIKGLAVVQQLRGR